MGLVLDFGLCQCGLAADTPVDRLLALVHHALLDELAECADDRRLVSVVHRQVRLGPEAEYAEALARAYNRWRIDKWLTRSEGLYGALLAAPQDPAGAAREIRKLGNEERVVGVFLPTCGVYPLYGNRKYDPIYEAAEEMG